MRKEKGGPADEFSSKFSFLKISKMKPDEHNNKGRS